MKRHIWRSILAQSTIRLFWSFRFLHSVSRRNLIALPQIQSSDSEETRVPDLIPGIIHDKDLLKATPDGNLLALDLIDRGAMESDARLYMDLFKQCTAQSKIREAKMVHSHFKNSRFRDYIALQNTVIHMYARCGEMELARKVFDEMPERDMVSFTTVITGYSQCNLFNEALLVFVNMLNSGFKPNEFTFGSALKSAGGSQSDAIGRIIHGFCLKLGFERNVFVGSALVDMYARCTKKEAAKVIFDALTDRNEVSWNALIASYARDGEGHNAVRLFAEMKRERLRPSHFTYSSVFSACASSGASEQGKWAHADMVKSGLKLTAFVTNTLVNMYGKAGNIDDARKVFNFVQKKDIIAWNTMLTAFAEHGLGDEAVDLFEKMRRVGVEPNAITFLCVLKACSHGGLSEKGFYYFELMRRYEIEPDITHYVTIIDLLGRAGQLDRAMKFIQQMSIEPTAVVWKALLGACRMHKNMELGIYAAERVFELDSNDTGPRILLSNIYASAGRLIDAARVRRTMNSSGLKKEPACSWVESGNVIHLFVANDDAHPRRDEIRKMWDELRDGIAKIGYVPDTSNVLWYSDEREREERLQYHSEKLALAFSILDSPSGAPISIKKNLRVCGDCHTAFKYVSKLVDREIVLRDTSRFHHFRHGSCSCRDYW
ncbi:pentatricopeptide repeat-containing protein At3g24000, mitochondrial [Andrographis paniculata]|uniref:pentatricopeptide repeat-containing protein At3g24000, mitochondrial n=1 Tax=Andrographis paniculata TaxID=175694 RepID=UPI0021E90689|nr:pentatricopeptide repeat-containing protein At3g24000, mitochondrial [Andrographis paniculata]